MHTPTIFCPTCGRYVGAAEACIFCGWERPAGLRIPAAGEPLWRRPTAAAADGHPLPVGELVLLADRSGVLTAVSLADGAVAWQWPGEGPLRPTLAGRAGRVYAARREGDLLALNLTPRPPLLQGEGGTVVGEGSVRWRFPLPSPGAPVMDEGRIYLGTGEGTVLALTDAGDRPVIAWRTPVGGRVALAPVRWRHLLLVATSHAQGALVALDAGRGELAWSHPLGARAAALILPSPPRRGAGGEVLPSPGRRGAGGEVVRAGAGGEVGGEVITLTDRGLARAFRLPDGEPLNWSYQVAGGAPVAAVGEDGVIYLGGAGGEVVALDRTTAAPRKLADYDAPIVGLAAWEGLLYIATRGGKLHLLDATDGVEQGHWDAHGPLTAGPTIVGDAILVGGEEGWLALPWHLGQWRWAAARFRARGNLEATAACHALVNEPDAAEEAWLAAGRPELAAWFWAGLGDDRRAAQAFRRAADAERSRQPALAAAYLNQAADRLEACEAQSEAATCRQLAGRMGRFPYLRLKLINIGATEAGEPMTVAFEVRNLGNATAEQVRFHLGGRLARSVTGVLTTPLPPNAGAQLELEGLIPVASGHHRLAVSIMCGDECSPAVRADASFEFDVAEPPPGAITIRDDAGAVIVRVPEGAPLPRVRVGGMVGMVKVEVV